LITNNLRMHNRPLSLLDTGFVYSRPESRRKCRVSIFTKSPFARILKPQERCLAQNRWKSLVPLQPSRTDDGNRENAPRETPTSVQQRQATSGSAQPKSE